MIANEYMAKTAIKGKYDYLSKPEIDSLFDTAKNTYLSLAFPFAPELMEIPYDRPRAYQWIYDCMEELLEKEGCASMSSYSENGLSITWDGGSGISKSLKAQIVPKAGTFL